MIEFLRYFNIIQHTHHRYIRILFYNFLDLRSFKVILLVYFNF